MFNLFNWIFKFVPFFIFFVLIFMIIAFSSASKHKNGSGSQVKIEEKYNRKKEYLESLSEQSKECIEQDDFYCEYCGSRVDKSAKKCDCCGARIRKK